MTTGSVAAQRARHAAVGEQVLERLGAAAARAGASGRPRARCGPRSCPPSAAASSVASSGPAGSTGPGWSSARTSQPPNRQLPGSAQARPARARRRLGARRRSGRSPPRRRRRRPPPSSTSPPSGCAARRRISRGAGAAERDRAPRGALGERAQRQPAQRRARARRARRREIATAPASAPALGERLEHDAAPSSSASSASSARVSAMLRSAAGLELAQHRQHLGADPVAGEARVVVGRVVGERQPGGGRELADALALEREQRPDDPAAARRQPEQRPRPGRDGEPVEHRLGEVGAGVAGGDPVGAGAVAQPLGGRVAASRAAACRLPSRELAGARRGGRCRAARRAAGSAPRRRRRSSRRP